MSNEQRELGLANTRNLMKKEKRRDRERKKEAKKERDREAKEKEQRKIVSGGRAPARGRAWVPWVDFSDAELQGEWAAFQLYYRQRMRYPMTPISRGRFVMKLNRWTREEALEALRWSIEVSYRGIFLPKPKSDFVKQKPKLPWSMRERKINRLNERKAFLMRQEETPKVRAELARIQAELIDL